MIVCFASALRRSLRSHCVHCHEGAKPKGGLSLVSAEGLQAGGDSGPVVVAGKPDESLLLEYISGDEPQMPKGEKPLSAAEVATIREWIAGGAAWPAGVELTDKRPYDLDWWSLRPLDRPSPPAVQSDWIRTPIDAFILAKLQEQKLAPSPEADRRTLIRRLYFDLVGLPPSFEEVQAFVADPDPHAYEKLVDRLLASPDYGERWGRHWLDVVHYGDTHGYDKDKVRPNAWPYRDYVIRAFNDDKPYGRFVEEQVAGDVLYPATADGIIATGFHRGGAVRFRRPDRSGGGHAGQGDHAEPRSRRHGDDHDRHVQQHDGAVRAVPQSQVRSDHAGGLLQPAGGVRGSRSGGPAVSERRRRRGGGRGVRRGERVRAAGRSSCRRTANRERCMCSSAAAKRIRRRKLGRVRAAICRNWVRDFDVDDRAGEGARRAALAHWLVDKRNPLTWRSIVNRVWQYHFGGESSTRRTISAGWGAADASGVARLAGGRVSRWAAIDQGAAPADLHERGLSSIVGRQRRVREAGWREPVSVADESPPAGGGGGARLGAGRSPASWTRRAAGRRSRRLASRTIIRRTTTTRNTTRTIRTRTGGASIA